jgi:hypothetical protein
MQQLTRPSMPQLHDPVDHLPRHRQHRRLSLWLFVGAPVTLVAGLILGTILIAQANNATMLQAHSINTNCSLIVPPHPLTARGLATPYQLVATNPNQGPCHEANDAQAAFVQGAIINPANGQIFVYNPLVTDKGTPPAIPPVTPHLPPHAIVALWFGFNGDTLTLQGRDNSLNEAHCVNGLHQSLFGQFAYCNAPNFFEAAKDAIHAGKLSPPPLGRGKDGLTCPSIRDFSVVDQDQSDNVTTIYIITNNGRTAQATAANIARLQRGSRVRPTFRINGSDNGLLNVNLAPALGCTSYTAPDLANGGRKATALPLNELQAAAFQPEPVALVPAGDPMVLVNDNPNLEKLNLYRRGVNQPIVENLGQASTRAYCKHLIDIAPPRLLFDSPFTLRAASPNADIANNLFTFLAQRFNTTWGKDGLNCQGLLHQKSPIVVTTNNNGVAIAASINGIRPHAHH